MTRERSRPRPKYPAVAAKQIDRKHVEYRCPYCRERHNDFLENQGRLIQTGCGRGRIHFLVLPKHDVFRVIEGVRFRLLNYRGELLVTPGDRVVNLNSELDEYLRRHRQIERIA